jgi:pimeloyl-ACP methyl ester carboxylesterase
MPEDPNRGNLAIAGAAPWHEHGAYRGVVFEPAATARGTVLFFHGNAGAAQYRSIYARPITAQGFRVVLHEYPGYGARPGKATLREALASAHEDAALARARWTGPMILMGESLGAALAVQVAQSNPGKFDGIVLFTPWKSLASLVNEKFMHLPLSLLLRERLDTGEALASYKGKVVIIGAEKDTIIPVMHARSLAGTAMGRHYIELKGVGHNDWFDALDDRDWARLLQMLSE